MEISTRQLLAPRPPVPIVRQDMTDPRVIRENAERVALTTTAWSLINKARTLKEVRWAFGFVRQQLMKPQVESVPDGGRTWNAVVEAYKALDRSHANHDARKAAKANSAIADVNTH